MAVGSAWYSRASAHERCAILGPDVRRVDHRQLPHRQPPRRNEVQHGERVVRGRLIVLVVRDQSPTEVRRQHLERPKRPPRKRGLPRTRRADQDDEREFGDGSLHATVPGSIYGEIVASWWFLT